VALCLSLAVSIESALADPWEEASRNGEAAREAFLRCWRFTQGWLQFVDPQSGLLPRNLNRDAFWNARDCAADNYPFMVLTAFFTDKPLFDGRMKDILAAEQRLCNRIDRLPDDFAFETQTFRFPEAKMDDVIFGASEYVKDSLLPLTEMLGQTPWSDRMIALTDDIWKYATYRTDEGPIPAVSHEVGGDHMQALSRLYWMTGNAGYKRYAFRVANHFLLHHAPDQAETLQLDDHGCEVVNGLSEVYYIAAQEHGKEHEEWKIPMHRMLDRILEVGRDENGLLHSRVNPSTGEKLTEDRTDNWGYNYNAFLVVAKTDNEPKYRDAVAFVLENIIKSKDYPWEMSQKTGKGTSDGYADSIEGCLNLLNRIYVPSAAEWIDYSIRKMFDIQRDTGIIEGWHGDGNFARTALMYALWKTQGAHVEPWRADVCVGAATGEDGAVYFAVTADWPWKGKLIFDVPRHTEYFHIPTDYPRLNQFPEWFTVRKDVTYVTENAEMSGDVLRKGVDLAVTPELPYRLMLKPKP
jgi:hypothetical protein